MNSSLDYVGNVVYAITSDNNNLAYVAVTCASTLYTTFRLLIEFVVVKEIIQNSIRHTIYNKKKKVKSKMSLPFVFSLAIG